MAYCKSCGVGIVCKDRPNPMTGQRRGLCERPVDWAGNHIRAGRKYSKLGNRRGPDRATTTTKGK